jgi:hypothetical protein
VAAGLTYERATVLSCAAVQPPPRQNTEAEIRRLESDDDWEQSRDLGIRCYGDGGPYLDRRARARRRLTQSGRAAWFGAFTEAACCLSSGCATPAAGWPVTRTSRPTPGPAAGAWPGRWSGARRLRGRGVRRGHARHRGRPGGGSHPRLPRLRLRRAQGQFSFERGAAAG